MTYYEIFTPTQVAEHVARLRAASPADAVMADFIRRVVDDDGARLVRTDNGLTIEFPPFTGEMFHGE